jgi:integrase
MRNAIEEGIIRTNPFAKVPKSVGPNFAREVYVSRAAVEALIEASRDPEERLLLGLSRYAALRMPSEIRELTWNRFDPGNGGERGPTLRVATPKTAHRNKVEKVVPVFPELLRLLEEARATATDASPYLLPRLRREQNPLMRVRRLAKRAGIPMWHKVTQSLRASAITDWCRNRDFGLAEVAAWAGNTVPVITRHYLRLQSFDCAARASATTRHPPRIDGGNMEALHRISANSGRDEFIAKNSPGLTPEIS